MRRSAVQKKVLSMYKQLLRLVETKPIENQAKLRNAVRSEFRHRVNLDKRGALLPSTNKLELCLLCRPLKGNLTVFYYNSQLVLG